MNLPARRLSYSERDYYAELFGSYLILISLLFLTNLFNIKGQEILWVNGHHHPLLDQFFMYVTLLGNGGIFVPVIIYLFVAKDYRKVWVGVVAWLGHGLICFVLKKFIFYGFKRPAAVLENDLLHFIDGVSVHHHFSFPSGHTATIFCFAVFVSLVFKNRWISMILMVTALLVAYSRMYLLQHFLEDIIGGAFVGASISFLAYHHITIRKLPRIRFGSWVRHRLNGSSFARHPARST